MWSYMIVLSDEECTFSFSWDVSKPPHDKSPEIIFDWFTFDLYIYI